MITLKLLNYILMLFFQILFDQTQRSIKAQLQTFVKE